MHREGGERGGGGEKGDKRGRSHTDVTRHKKSRSLLMELPGRLEMSVLQFVS